MSTTLTLLNNINDDLNPTGDPVRLSSHLGRNMFTVSIRMNNFIGNISIEASLDANPEDDDWFRVKLQDIYQPDFANNVRQSIVSSGTETNIVIDELSRNDWYAVSPGEITSLGIHTTEWNIINGFDLSELDPQTVSSSTQDLINNSIVIPLGNSGNNFWGIARTADNELLIYSDNGPTNFNPFSIYKIVSDGTDQTGTEYLRYDSYNNITGTVGYNFVGNYLWLRSSIKDNTSGSVKKILVLC